MNIRRKTLLTAIAPLLLAGIAQAETDEASTAAIYACADTSDDAARLACYDAAVGRLKAAEEAGEITTITREEVENVQRDTFGLSLPSLPAIAMPRFGGDPDNDGQLDTITSRVTDIRRNSYDYVVVTLENGQIWRQTEGGRFSLRGIEEAEIRRAALGSFKMKLDGGRAFRVKRIQ
ncbi:MAG: hypothetical protein AAFQ22_02905 [Pseudomonadota bacterium]